MNTPNPTYVTLPCAIGPVVFRRDAIDVISPPIFTESTIPTSDTEGTSVFTRGINDPWLISLPVEEVIRLVCGDLEEIDTRKHEADLRLLNGVLLMLKEHGIQVGSAELIAAADRAESAVYREGGHHGS